MKARRCRCSRGLIVVILSLGGKAIRPCAKCCSIAREAITVNRRRTICAEWKSSECWISSTRLGNWLVKRGQARFEKYANEFADPGRNQVRQMRDDELAELLARNPHDKLGQLAASEMRSRESWRGPRKWSLIIAGLALLVSIGALFHTIWG